MGYLGRGELSSLGGLAAGRGVGLVNGQSLRVDH